jgi:hypothetical protein
VRSEEMGTTYADVSKLYKTIKYKPQTSIDKMHKIIPGKV